MALGLNRSILRTMTIILISGLSLLFSLSLLYAGLVLYAFRGMFRAKPADPDWILSSSLESGDIEQAWLEKPWQHFELLSRQGNRLAAYALAGSTSKTAVFHHGFGWSWYGMLRYMRPFIDAGWNVLALDSRGHGRSGRGVWPSFGYYEKHDLAQLLDRAYELFPDTDYLLTYGESMGAATVLQHAAIDSRVQAVVADCSFSSAADELDHHLRRRFLPGWLRSSVIRSVNALLRRLDGFSIHDAAPDKAIMQTAVPILLIHGQADRYVPWEFSVRMYQARKGMAPTYLLLVPEARHARSRHIAPELYDSTVADFVRRFQPDR